MNKKVVNFHKSEVMHAPSSQTSMDGALCTLYTHFRSWYWSDFAQNLQSDCLDDGPQCEVENTIYAKSEQYVFQRNCMRKWNHITGILLISRKQKDNPCNGKWRVLDSYQSQKTVTLEEITMMHAILIPKLSTPI